MGNKSISKVLAWFIVGMLGSLLVMSFSNSLPQLNYTVVKAQIICGAAGLIGLAAGGKILARPWIAAFLPLLVLLLYFLGIM